MKILVYIRSVYGTMRVYPNNEAAHTLARIIGDSTISVENLINAVKLGHQVEVEGEPLRVAPIRAKLDRALSDRNAGL